MNRIRNLKDLAFTQAGFDGFLVFNSANLLYFTGVPGACALFVPPNGESTLYVYGVNYEQVKSGCKGFCVERLGFDENLLVTLAKQVQDHKLKNIAADALSVQSWQALTQKLPQAKIAADPKPVQMLRQVKDPNEITLMRKAADITSQAMNAAYETLRPGVKECEVAAEIESTMRRNGGGATAFETIVASGASSAFPHGGCSAREIREGDFVVVDIGATFEYYCSDMTRTLVAGVPSERQRRLYQIVHDAQDKAFETLKPNVCVSDVDKVARDVIEAAGYGENFVHRLGHGVGLEVHEPPTLSSASSHILQTGNVVTIEPGIYLHGFGGVRIEDTALITQNGAEKLTAGSYRLNPQQPVI
ncbi:MAG: Xaa-Pro peptidase family protein [Candidatus Bathyarchaeota archaeon]|nr:Xaa-Pro peptidase family protein [Candidatus Bathyarchaeota archaeon]